MKRSHFPIVLAQPFGVRMAASTSRTTPPERSPVGKVMEWQFPPLIERLMQEEGFSIGEARQLFHDLKLFLYVCGQFEQAEPPLSPPELIEVAWHHFILHTRVYARFCERHFGGFIHHSPLNLAQRAVMRATGQDVAGVARAIERARAIHPHLSIYWTTKPANSSSPT